MRVGVIGAGAVGGVIAALLDRAGHQVTVTVRGEHLAAIRDTGLQLSGHWGEHTAHLDAVEILPAGLDLVIATTKAQDAAAALAANAATIDGLPVLIVQNGLEGMAVASAALPNSPIAGGLALFAASYLSPGRVSITTPAHTYLGGSAAPFAALLDGVLPVSIVENFAGAQWTKLIVNQLNALPAITGLSVQEVIHDRRLRRVMTASMREAVRVGISTGVHFVELQGLSDARLRLFARLPLWIGQILPLMFRRVLGATPNPGSTLQSIRRGQLTEIDYLNGAIAAAGRAPINAALVAMVHEVERTGTFISPGEVVTLVEAASPGR
ncbi:MAG: ketopantoate reductase family protein [Microbacteriaceae bacterium]